MYSEGAVTIPEFRDFIKKMMLEKYPTRQISIPLDYFRDHLHHPINDIYSLLPEQMAFRINFKLDEKIKVDEYTDLLNLSKSRNRFDERSRFDERKRRYNSLSYILERKTTDVTVENKMGLYKRKHFDVYANAVRKINPGFSDLDVATYNFRDGQKGNCYNPDFTEVRERDPERDSKGDLIHEWIEIKPFIVIQYQYSFYIFYIDFIKPENKYLLGNIVTILANAAI